MGVPVGRRGRRLETVSPCPHPLSRSVLIPAEVEEEQEERVPGWMPILRDWKAGILTSDWSLGSPRKL